MEVIEERTERAHFRLEFVYIFGNEDKLGTIDKNVFLEITRCTAARNF